MSLQIICISNRVQKVCIVLNFILPGQKREREWLGVLRSNTFQLHIICIRRCRVARKILFPLPMQTSSKAMASLFLSAIIFLQVLQIPAAKCESIFMSMRQFDHELRTTSSAGRIFFQLPASPQINLEYFELFLDALFVTNPSANVYFVMEPSKTPALSLMNKYVRRGFYLRGVSTSFRHSKALGRWTTPGNLRFLSRVFRKSSTLIDSYVSQYLAFALIFRYGGAYMDLGTIPLQQLPDKEFLGVEKAIDFDFLPKDGPKKNDNFSIIDTQYIHCSIFRFHESSPLAGKILEESFPNEKRFRCADCDEDDGSLRRIRWTDTIARYAGSVTVYKSRRLDLLSALAPANATKTDAIEAPILLFHALRRHSMSLQLYEGLLKGIRVEARSVMYFLRRFLSLAAEEDVEKCSFGGESVFVVKSNGTKFINSNMVFLRDCPALASNVDVHLNVKQGTLRNGQNSGRSLFFPGLSTLARVNQVLSSTSYDIPEDVRKINDTLQVQIVVAGKTVASESRDMLVLNRMVTLVTHTNGREQHVQRLWKSLQEHFPGTPMLATDDTINFHEGENRTRDSLGPGMEWVAVPLDAGLSAARNAMLQAAKTPFVQLLDDDFRVGPRSHLDILLSALWQSKDDIAGAVIPADTKNFGHFRGLMSTDGDELRLERGDRGGAWGGCLRVDFVPNVFMGRKESLRKITWDPQLKLGEHEDFFLRAKKQGLKVMSCDHVEVLHEQERWWVEGGMDPEYNLRRHRVFAFFRIALQKHKLKRLRSFGTVMATI